MKIVFLLILFFGGPDISVAEEIKLFDNPKVVRRCVYDVYSLEYFTDGHVVAERSGYSTSFSGDSSILKNRCPESIWAVSTTRGGNFATVYTSNHGVASKIKLDHAYDYDGQSGNHFGSSSSGNSQNNLNVSVSWCNDPNVLKAMSIVGYIIYVVKVLVPIAIIVVGIKSFFNTVTNQDGDIKKASFALISKFLVGAIIFFIPTLINTVMDLVDDYDSTKSKFSRCTACLTDPNDCN